MKHILLLVATLATTVLTAVPASANVKAMPNGDYDGDRRADPTVLRLDPQNLQKLQWHIRYSSSADTGLIQHGQTPATPVPGDYDGDGKQQPALWMCMPPIACFFAIKQRSSQPSYPWGTVGDDPTVVADYDGDGATDLAVYRPGSPSTWWIHGSAGADIVTAWGEAGDIPAPGDYDGDGHVAVARPAADGSLWFWINRTTTGFALVHWGQDTDEIVPTDFDGDGATDITVVRDTDGILTWYTTNGHGDHTAYFGESGNFPDLPTPGDYDGDGYTDLSVWRPTSPGRFYILHSGTGVMIDQPWGEPGDYPTANFNTH